LPAIIPPGVLGDDFPVSSLTRFGKESLYDHQAPRFIHIDHKFAKALSHAFDVYSMAVSLGIYYNLTVVYEPLLNLAEAERWKNNSTPTPNIQGGRIAKLPPNLDWLGLHKNTLSPSDLDRLYTAEELAVVEINSPCSSSSGSSRLALTNRSSLRPVKVMDSRTIKINLENILSSANPNKPLLIRGCGYSMSYKPAGDAGRVVRYLRSQTEPTLGMSMSMSMNMNMSNDSSGRAEEGSDAGRDHRVIAVHIRRGDYLQPQLTASILGDAYYADTVCKLLNLLGNDRTNRFVVLSEGSRTGLYVDETGQPSDLREKVAAHCPLYSTQASDLRWDMLYLLDGSVSVVETLQIMVGASVLITSKSRLSKMAATYSQGLVVVPSSIVSSYKGVPSVISAPDVVNHKDADGGHQWRHNEAYLRALCTRRGGNASATLTAAGLKHNRSIHLFY